MENKEWVWENGSLFEKEVEIKRIINNECKQGGLTEEKLVGLFQKILTLV